MNLIEQLELPLPTIEADMEKLYIETATSYTGIFNIRNVGGGKLSGFSQCNKNCVTFSPSEFEGNKVQIEYFINIAAYNSGEVIRTEILIASNGGEIIIPCIIKIIAPAIETEDGMKITSLKEFYVYSKKYILEARQLFSESKFKEWLYSINYEYMDIYEYLVKDANKERAMYNFFILNKLKKKTTIEVEEKNVQIKVGYYQRSKFLNLIKVKRSDGGFVEYDVKLKNNCRWISLSKNKLIVSDFKDSNMADVMYSIDSSKLSDKNAVDYIMIGDEVIRVNIKRESLIDLGISKESFKFVDEGSILVGNNSEKQVVIEISTNSSLVRFENKKYIVNESAEIPFVIKLNAFLSTQLALKKQPIVTGEIYVKAQSEEGIFRKTMYITIGELVRYS